MTTRTQLDWEAYIKLLKATEAVSPNALEKLIELTKTKGRIGSGINGRWDVYFARTDLPRAEHILISGLSLKEIYRSEQHRDFVPTGMHRTGWAPYIALLKATHAVSQTALNELIMLTNGNIGFEQGQIRPGAIGRWDVYYSAFEIPNAERILISGLGLHEIWHEDYREKILDEYCLDIDDPKQLKQLQEEQRFQAALKRLLPDIDDRIWLLSLLSS